MRSFVALTLYVSFAVSPAVSAPAAGWREVHRNALDAAGSRNFAEAEQLLRTSWTAAATPVEKAISANDLGVTLHALSHDAEAKQWLERSRDFWPVDRTALSNKAQTSEALAVVERALGEYGAAEKTLRSALATEIPNGESRAALLNQLGDMMRELAHASEARAAFENALAMPGISNRVRIDATLGMADLDRGAQLWESSMERWNRALAIARTEHWTAAEAGALRGLADTLVDQGENARAEPLLRRSMAIFEDINTGGPEVASTLQSIARLMIASGKPGLAAEAMERSLSIQENYLGPDHPQVAIALEMMGDAAARQGRIDEARGRYTRALRIMAARFGERSPMVGAVQASWALNEQRAKLDSAAAKDYEAALGILRGAGPETQSLVFSVMRNYADALEGAHRKHEASAVRAQMKSAFTR